MCRTGQECPQGYGSHSSRPLGSVPFTVSQRFSSGVELVAQAARQPPSMDFLPCSVPLPFSYQCFLGSPPK